MIKTGSILIYILFAQVYPVVHWHAYQHHDGLELRLSVHPPEFPVDTERHDSHDKQSDSHEHEHVHFEGNWEYTFQIKIFSTVISKQFYPNIDSADIEQRILNRQPLDIPLKIPGHYLPLTISDRAPPQRS
jgi:hypothetical protein